MSITLDQFRAISNGSHNVGQIALTDDGKDLQKVNNHVWQTGKNNYLLTGNQNRAVRAALVDAFRGHVSDRAMSVIEDLLLGGGRDRLSLSRDFVKLLISRATSPKVGGGLILADMVNVGKSLLNRSVKVAGGGEKPEGNLTTSGLKAAFTSYVSESMDQSVVAAQSGLAGISESISKSDPLRLMASVRQVVSSVAELAKKDPRIGHLPKLADLENGIDVSQFCKENGDLVKTDAGVVQFGNLLERKIRSAFQKADVPRNVRNDLLPRVFGGPAIFANFSVRLREDFDDIASGMIERRDDRPLKHHLQDVYVNFLRAVENAVKNSTSLNGVQKDAILSKVYIRIGDSYVRNSRLSEFAKVFDGGIDADDEGEIVTTFNQRSKDYFLKELDALFAMKGVAAGLADVSSGMDEVKSKCINAFVELGLGLD